MAETLDRLEEHLAVLGNGWRADERRRTVGLVPGYFDSHGWGFGVSIVTRREGVAGSVGKFGWDGGLGTSWYADPREDMVTILMTQAAWTSPSPPDICLDFWTSGPRPTRRSTT